MSVSLVSKNGEVDVNVSNGSWAAVVALARAFGSDACWNGNHDPHFYTPEQLNTIADRLESSAQLVEAIRDLAKNGGAHLS